ncbi:MAG: PQQ-binding-like beta-propeller repeat protein [Candidatus Paceibacterota bacterium]
MDVIVSGKNSEQKLAFLKQVIEGKVFMTSQEQRIVDENSNTVAWTMDFRKVLLDGEVLSCVVELFLEKIYKDTITKFQVGGLETAAIPLVTGMVMKAKEQGKTVNGFFIRKSRKKYGLLQMVEGTLGDEDIVLVDDLLNSGNSIVKQLDILDSLGKKVRHVCVILTFKDTEVYTEILARGITIHSLFSLEELNVDVGAKNTIPLRNITSTTPLTVHWCFTSPGAILEQVIPKSSPLLYEGMLYFGSDSGIFWCIDAKTASVLWQRKVLYGPQGKRIFSSPAILNGIVYFGGYDGNFYALEYKTGKPKWVAFDADWIGSSPCVSDDLGLVFVGMEFGLLKRKGGVAAYRADTGEMVWKTVTTEYTHASPSYSKKHKIVVCGSNDGVVYGFSAKDGKILWTYDTGGEIKAGCSFSPSQNFVAVGSFNKCYVVLETKTGKIVSTIETREGNYSTPTWLNEDILIFASLDKCVYAYTISTNKILWKFVTDARIFASPFVVNNTLYIGNNAGFLFVLNVLTGELLSQHYVIERITNPVLIDQKERAIYIPTQANQVIKADFSVEL